MITLGIKHWELTNQEVRKTDRQRGRSTALGAGDPILDFQLNGSSFAPRAAAQTAKTETT